MKLVVVKQKEIVSLSERNILLTMKYSGLKINILSVSEVQYLKQEMIQIK